MNTPKEIDSLYKQFAIDLYFCLNSYLYLYVCVNSHHIYMCLAILSNWCIVYIKYLKIFERERDCEQESEGERMWSKRSTEHRAQCMARFHNLEILTWVEIKIRALNQLCHAGTAYIKYFKDLEIT